MPINQQNLWAMAMDMMTVYAFRMMIENHPEAEEVKKQFLDRWERNARQTWETIIENMLNMARSQNTIMNRAPFDKQFEDMMQTTRDSIEKVMNEVREPVIIEGADYEIA